MILMLVLIVLFAWLLRMHFDQQKKRINLPGPKLLPIVGNIFGTDLKQLHLASTKLHKQYGNAVYNRVFNNGHTVLIGDAKLARELYSLDEITGRISLDFFITYEGEPYGIASSEGELWEIHRRFTLRHLRDFGYGKNTMETLVMDEVHELIDIIKQKNGAPIGQIKKLFTLAVVNSLWTIINGKRYSQVDEKIKTFVANLKRVFTEPIKSGGIIFFLPALRHICPNYLGYTGIRDAFEQLKRFVQDAVNEHKRTFQPESCRDFIDAYLKEMQSANDPSNTFYGEAGEKQLVATVADLFFAGFDTTSATLAWAILYLVKHQKVQEKLRTEIISVTGNNRDVSASDKPNMPYLLAVIDEVLRLSSILPNGIHHKVLSEVTHKGVTYPKGTFVGVTLYHIHRNTDTWGADADEFRPERFLSDDGKTYIKNDNLIPFSVGKRHCIGENLARLSLFLFIGNIFQNFHVVSNPNEPEPTLEPAPGFVLYPKEYSVIFKNQN